MSASVGVENGQAIDDVDVAFVPGNVNGINPKTTHGEFDDDRKSDVVMSQLTV